MGKFAQATKVSVEKTRMEIELMLGKYGASAFGYAKDEIHNQAIIQFFAKERQIRFMLQLPKRSESQFQFGGKGVKRKKLTEWESMNLWEQSCRQRWRALLLCIKAKLEAVDCGISHFEDEFLANIVLPDGTTISNYIRPQLARIAADKQMPAGLSGFLSQSTEKA